MMEDIILQPKWIWQQQGRSCNSAGAFECLVSAYKTVFCCSGVTELLSSHQHHGARLLLRASFFQLQGCNSKLASTYYYTASKPRFYHQIGVTSLSLAPTTVSPKLDKNDESEAAITSEAQGGEERVGSRRTYGWVVAGRQWCYLPLDYVQEMLIKATFFSDRSSRGTTH